MTTKSKAALIALTCLFVASLILLALQPSIPQDPTYHNFADGQPLSSIPNFLNVISNLPFLLVGLLGLKTVYGWQQSGMTVRNPLAYYGLFAGVALVCFGSSYYHLWPSNETLMWDRLPMTIAFMSLVSIIVSEFVCQRIGKALLLPLIVCGVLSVLYWYYTELQGAGDLRPYALVQFFPMLAIPVILLCFDSKSTNSRGYWWLLLWYVLAKLLEHFDEQVYALLGFVSGHSLKHVAAAIGVYVLLRQYRLTTPH